MKIEKVNDNQIRCTLTREDLASRELKISELAYGTEKAKNLFRDMMRQANFEFGFEAEDIPLMIEAIPLNAECIVLIITKVEDPDELDTRFARFAPSVTEELEGSHSDDYDEQERDVLDLFRKLSGKDTPALPNASSDTEPAPAEAETRRPMVRLFRFRTLSEIMNGASVTASRYQGASTLYKDEKTGSFFLLLTQEDNDRETFDRTCNILSEYGALQRSQPASLTFLAEHYEVLIAENALQALGR